MPGLDEFLDRTQEETVAPTEETTETTEETAETVEEKGEETAAPPATKTEPQEDITKQLEAFKRKAIDEAHKRQELERQLAERQEKPDFWEDPEARLTEITQTFEQKLLAERLNISEAFAREKYADFQEKLDVFAAMVNENPALYHQMTQQINPAEFVYKTASQVKKMQEMGDPTAYEAKLKADIEAKLKAEYDTKLAEELKKRDELPGSLAQTRNVKGQFVPQQEGPTPIGDILK